MQDPLSFKEQIVRRTERQKNQIVIFFFYFSFFVSFFQSLGPARGGGARLQLGEDGAPGVGDVLGELGLALGELVEGEPHVGGLLLLEPGHLLAHQPHDRLELPGRLLALRLELQWARKVGARLSQRLDLGSREGSFFSSERG